MEYKTIMAIDFVSAVLFALSLLMPIILFKKSKIERNIKIVKLGTVLSLISLLGTLISKTAFYTYVFCTPTNILRAIVYILIAKHLYKMLVISRAINEESRKIREEVENAFNPEYFKLIYRFKDKVEAEFLLRKILQSKLVFPLILLAIA